IIGPVPPVISTRLTPAGRSPRARICLKTSRHPINDSEVTSWNGACRAIVPGSPKAFDTPFTALRPGYFFQNDGQLKAGLTGAGLYPNAIGKAGNAAVDVRDIADAAVVSLTTDGHTGKTYNLVAPDPLSGPGAAAIWSEVLNKQVRYADLPVETF